ncbi:MAG: hypothetical protein ACI9EH_001800 [Planktomarina sp.]|jgi:uncharacterized protein (TIGR02186 family)
MRLFYAYVLTAMISLVGPAVSQDIVLGLSKQEIGITAFFDGSEILIFGAVKHQSEASSEGDLDVVVTIASPRIPVTVRRKEKRLGIWVNVDALEVDLAPSFYAVATTRPFDEVVSQASDLWHQISVRQLIRAVSVPVAVENPEEFTEALVRVRENDGLYQTLSGAVILQDQTLFSTSVSLPSNLVEGAYTARIFLMNDGDVVSEYQTSIDVRKVGMERWLYNLAHERPVVYGLLSLAIAIFAGWAAAAAFRAVRG